MKPEINDEIMTEIDQILSVINVQYIENMHRSDYDLYHTILHHKLCDQSEATDPEFNAKSEGQVTPEMDFCIFSPDLFCVFEYI